MTDRTKKLIKLLERMIQQEHLYPEDKLREMKTQLRELKEAISMIQSQEKKGFK